MVYWEIVITVRNVRKTIGEIGVLGKEEKL